MSLKQLVNTPAIYQAFQEYVEEKINHLHKRLESAKDPADFYSVQGQILTYRALQRLRDEVNRVDD